MVKMFPSQYRKSSEQWRHVSLGAPILAVTRQSAELAAIRQERLNCKKYPLIKYNKPVADSYYRHWGCHTIVESQHHTRPGCQRSSPDQVRLGPAESVGPGRPPGRCRERVPGSVGWFAGRTPCGPAGGQWRPSW